MVLVKKVTLVAKLPTESDIIDASGGGKEMVDDPPTGVTLEGKEASAKLATVLTASLLLSPPPSGSQASRIDQANKILQASNIYNY